MIYRQVIEAMDKENAVFIYAMEYYSAITNNGVLPFVITWMDTEGIM